MATLYAAKVADNTDKTVKTKKPPTEKQLAALAKATATRKRKREEAQQQAITEKQQELDDKKEELDAAMEKKRIANEKRKAARLAKKNQEEQVVKEEPVPVVKEVIKEVIKEVPVAKVETTNSGDTPPNWFRKFAENIVQHKNEVSDVKKPQKAVKMEARELADEKWAQPKVREQVSRNMESHYDKMYSQIFCGRGRA